MDRSKTQVAIQAPRGYAKCLEENTEIILNDGTRKKIKDREIADQILSLNDNFEFEHDLIVAKEYSGKKECLTFTSMSGKKLTTSFDHKILTFNGWKLAKDITLDDRIASPRFLPLDIECDTISDEEVKLLGYMIAEGGCTRSSFTNFDEVIIEDFKKCCDKLNFIVNPVIIHNEIRKGQFNISGGIRGWLREQNLYNHKSTEKRLPQWVYGLDRRQKWIFIASLWDTDGWFHVNGGKTGITLANEELIKDIQILLWNMEINTTIYFRPNDFANAWALLIDNYNLESFCNNIPLLLKKQKASEIIEKNRYSLLDTYPVKEIRSYNKGCKTRFRDKYNIRIDRDYDLTRDKLQRCIEAEPIDEWIKLEGADVFWDKIQKIENVGAAETYDVQVLNNANLITNGLISHNSSLSVPFILHHITHDPGNKVIVIQSKTQSEAINRLTQIKNIFEYSKTFRDLYGYAGQTVADQWTEKKIRTKLVLDGQVQCSITIKAIGTGMPARGQMEMDEQLESWRITLYFLDDADDEDNTLTPDQMDKNWDKFAGSKEGLDKRGGRVLVLGTFIRDGCIIDRLDNAVGWFTVKY
ncbi:MAG: LAGLIDADG family homing endonuclease, partial [Patescibacteria group bacterium]